MNLHKIILAPIFLIIFLLVPQSSEAARLFQDGFEFGTATCTACGYTATVTAAPTIDATSKRSGDYGMHIPSLTSGQDKGFRWRQVPTGTAVHWYWRGYLYVVSAPGANDSTIMALASQAAQTVVVVRLRLNDDMTITVIDEDGTVGTSAALSTGRWYRIELELDNTTGAGSHVVTLRADGSDLVTATNRSIAGLPTGFRIGGNINVEANATGEWYWDDIALNDTSGSNQTSYPGSGKIVHMEINNDGTTSFRGVQGTDWDTGPSTGGTAYQQVDEAATPNDATDYVVAISDSTAVDSGVGVLLFNLEPASSVGIQSSDTISVAAVRTRVTNSGAGTASYRQIIKSGSTYSESSDIGFAVTTWSWEDDVEPIFSKLITYTDPATSVAWTTSGLDSVEIGFRATDANPDFRVSQTLMQVEYVPAAGGAKTGVGLKSFIRGVTLLLMGGKLIIR